MNFKLTKIDEEYSTKLENYFDFHLRGRIDYQHVNPTNNQLLFETTIHFHNLNVSDSIYYFKNDECYYCGLGREIQNFVNINANSRISSNLKYNLKVKQAIQFAKDELDKLFFVMPINLDSLSDKEIFSLKEKNDIIEIDGSEYINFGEIKKGIHILRNIRNFIAHVTVDMDYTSYLKLIKVRILNKYARDSRFCSSCNNLINNGSNDNKIKKMRDDFPGICLQCYEKKLINYFLSSVPKFCMKKRNLELLSCKQDIFKFYLDLLCKYELFDENDELHTCICDDDFIPSQYKLDSSNLEKMQKMMYFIDNITVMDSIDSISSFEKVLLKNNLTYQDGLTIKNYLEKEVLLNRINFNKYENVIKWKLKSQIANKSKLNNNLTIDIFDISQRLNKKTLNSKGELNGDFVNQIKNQGLNEDICWEIRESLIQNVDSGLIKTENFDDSYSTVINEHIQENLSRLYSIKEYYCFNDKIHLKTILNMDEMKEFFYKFNSIKDSLDLSNFSLYKLNNNFFKIIIDFKINSANKNVLENVLNDFNFDKFVLNLNEVVI